MLSEYPGLNVLAQLIDQHRSEILLLINHCRPVTVAWQRHKGPAFFAAIISALRDQKTSLVRHTGNHSLQGLLRAMKKVLLENGSAGLRDAIGKWGDKLIDASEEAQTFEQLIQLMTKESVTGV